MGFYIRKAVRVGPFRFNLSKSGIGVSAGVRGLRFGTGPRGNYVHLGRGGLYYRKTLPAGQQTKRPPSADDVFDIPTLPTDSLGHEPLRAIDSADIRGLFDASSADLVEELSAKRRKWRSWPVVLCIGMAAAATTLFMELPHSLALVLLTGTAIATPIAAVNDKLRKTTVLLYDIDGEYEEIYQALHDAFAQMCRSHGQWHLAASGRVTDRKRHAGASEVVQRKPIQLRLEQPQYMKTNVEVPCIPVGTQSLYFFPDRVLAFEQNAVGGVSYQNLNIEVAPTRFIEDGSVPRDAKVVDHTWRFVNKSGGPDRRFNNNRQLPICLYESMTFRSESGLNEEIQLSNAGVGGAFAKAIQSVVRAQPSM